MFVIRVGVNAYALFVLKPYESNVLNKLIWRRSFVHPVHVGVAIHLQERTFKGTTGHCIVLARSNSGRVEICRSQKQQTHFSQTINTLTVCHTVPMHNYNP